MTTCYGQCRSCDGAASFEATQEELAALPECPNPYYPELTDSVVGECECGGYIRYIGKEPPTSITYGEIKITKPCMNLAKGVRTDAEQEAFYGKLIEKKRKRALETKRARHGTRRKDNELRHIGSIPREHYQAMVASTGDKRVWDKGGTKMLARHGYLFES